MASLPRALIAKRVKSADGLEIYAEATGDPSKPHVVFIHGVSLSSIVWDAQFSSRKLLKHIYAVRYDLRGHGRTGKPLDLAAWTSQRFAEDFEAIVKAFNLKRPILAGWKVLNTLSYLSVRNIDLLHRSYGCTTAVDIVTTFGPSYLSGIIYIGALSYTHAHHLLTPWQAQTNAVSHAHPESDVEYHHRARHEFVQACFARPEAVPAETCRAWVRAMETQPRAMFRRALRREQDATRFWAEGATTIPLLVMHGTQDRICDHDKLVEEARQRFKCVEIESWEGVGHAPFLDDVERFNEAVARWSKKVASRDIKALL